MFDDLVDLYYEEMETHWGDCMLYHLRAEIAYLEARLGPITSALAYDEADFLYTRDCTF